MKDFFAHPLVSVVVGAAILWSGSQLVALNREVGEVKVGLKNIEQMLTRMDKRLDRIEDHNQRVNWAVFNTEGDEDVRGDN
jgi:hypothetical protein